MLLSYAAVFEDLVVRAGLALPALDVLDLGDGAPDGSVKEGDPRRLVRVGRDTRDQRVDVGVAGRAEMLRPEHLMAAQAGLLQQDRQALFDLADRRLLARPPRQHEVLDRAAGGGGTHRGGGHLGDLVRADVGDQIELTASHDVAAILGVDVAVDIGGELGHLPNHRRAVAALGHALADHDGTARCAMAERMSLSTRRPVSAKCSVRMAILASPPSRRSSRISSASTRAVM
ncbi:hypothetical protein QO012_003110 [Methylobacterium aerolatum]|uniref:Uncharacterized protein n=1 Tax=Methylobacterium aerolatum TaxID=418708 RepID=A0ABU0I1W5_9HYPH|nr:hypothetical protein [Methylobacterium aerolatum]MDQ0448599.1 hypothetical protein [Methylobacterium aerolatum]